MRFHDYPRLRSIYARPPGSDGAYDPAVLIEFLRILPEIPDVSVPVLCEIVKCILSQDPTHKNFVVDYPTSHSVDDYRSVCNRKLISLLTAFPISPVNKSSAWWQREKRIVDSNREILGINVVRCIRCARDCQIQYRQRERSGESSYCVLSFHIRFPAG
jgi:hypothetical protein